MENTDIFFTLGFLILMLTSNFLCYAVRSYIQNKPPGSQTTYDVIYCDHMLLSQLMAAVVSGGAMFSRFDVVKSFCEEFPAAILIVMLVNTANFVGICVHNACLNCLRLAYLLNLNSVEENLSERSCR